MSLGLKVASGVFVLRIVAASDVATSETHAQVDPGIADPQAVLAAVERARAHVANLVQMAARSAHSAAEYPPRKPLKDESRGRVH
jgi:hypothetical protein